MLDPLSTWTQQFSALPPTAVAMTGVQNFASTLGTLMDKVQAGSNGTAGILTFNQPTFVTGLLTLAVVSDTSWAANLATVWQTAVTASTITPGTVTNAAWTSSITDVNTVGSAATTITTIASATSLLQSELLAVSAQFANAKTDPSVLQNSSQAMAKAFRDATLAFVFTCIGLALAPPGAPVPVPLTFSAQ